MKASNTLFVLLAVFFSAIQVQAAGTLFRNGSSEYVIVLAPDASRSETTAAKELQQYLKQVSGATLPIVGIDGIPAKVLKKSEKKGTRIYIGWSEELKKATGASRPDTSDEGFTVAAKGRSIFIYGGSLRGTMYGVYTFLEDSFGIRWFTPECTVVPQKSEWSFSDFEYSQSPALEYRFVQYLNAVRSAPWLAHNKDNAVWGAEDNEYGGLSAYWNAHTMGQFIPAGRYFEEHPEYFSVRNGERIPYGQLCLTNPDVLRLCIEGVMNAIEKNPLYWVYSVSQNDNMFPCECDCCKAVEEQYGGHSGVLLWFVNQVADAVKPVYPDKYIGTFAYQYTRQIPQNIVPRDNVVIRLCNIECDFAHPIAETDHNKSFLEDLKQWSVVAPHLFIWDYVVNFHQYLAPYPNFQTLASNIKLFKQYKAIGIQEEANYQSDGGEFSEMKAWVLAKLLWNPELDTDALVDEFIEGYYGAAAKKVKEYFNLCRSLVKEDTFMSFAFDENHSMFNEDFISESVDILADAVKAVEGDEELTRRVDRVKAQILYLKVMRHKEESKKDGSYKELRRIVDEERIRVREFQPNEVVFKDFE